MYIIHQYYNLFVIVIKMFHYFSNVTIICVEYLSVIKRVKYQEKY